jgi:soluble lytic murein transglycosylase-like protein
MSLWSRIPVRRSLALSVWMGLAMTPAQAQYAPASGAPQSAPAPAPVPAPATPFGAQTYPTAPAPYAVTAPIRPSYSSPSQTLSAALSAARGRDRDGARFYQAALPDPVARKLVDWALVDVFGEQLGPNEIARANTELAGWPREAGRKAALQRFSSPRAPSGPVAYSTLRETNLEAGEGSAFTAMRVRMNEALRAGDISSAYSAVANHGLTPGGTEFAEAESFAGWLALNKLRNPQLASVHFARLDANVRSPVSKARAAYWRGRTAEAAGQPDQARAFYLIGAQHTTTFYGQLAAEKTGGAQIVLIPDPVPTAAERAAFNDREVVRALRLLSSAGEKSLVRVFGLHLGDAAQTPTELAMAMDTIKALGEQELSLLAYRRGAQRNVILHERGYPVLTPPSVAGGAEPAFVLAITRQESQFDPRVRSSADARGMMQLLPGTARDTARKLGIGYDEGQLWEPVYNMRLGSAYLGQVADRFSGSYIMAAAGYNAGPGRPGQWAAYCGDPRASTTDPLDFIECIPFSETRNYVMNVMSNMQVYRARLGGGSAPINLSRDLRRGGFGYNMATSQPAPYQPSGSQPSSGYRVGGGGQ